MSYNIRILILFKTMLNLITYGGRGVFKTQVAFDALLDALGVKIEWRYFLTIPKYTYRSV